jgi:hypothetical protein
LNLDTNVISQFVKITNDNTRKNEIPKAYGKVVISEENTYVQLDGSDLLMPVENTVHVKDGERVIVSIKNHTATIDGNVSDISASNDIVVNLDVDMEDVKDVIDYVFIDSIEQMNALDKKVTSLETSVGQLQTDIKTKVTIDDVNVAITERLAENTTYIYESLVEVPAVGTTVVTLPQDIPANIGDKYVVLLDIKSYSFGDTWNGIITQKCVIYATTKTNKNFSIVSDITALKVSDFSKATNGKAVIKYTIMA